MWNGAVDAEVHEWTDDHRSMDLAAEGVQRRERDSRRSFRPSDLFLHEHVASGELRGNEMKVMVVDEAEYWEAMATSLLCGLVLAPRGGYRRKPADDLKVRTTIGLEATYLEEAAGCLTIYRASPRYPSIWVLCAELSDQSVAY